MTLGTGYVRLQMLTDGSLHLMLELVVGELLQQARLPYARVPDQNYLIIQYVQEVLT